uniref:Uncharacterized protein n=1 Tax=Salarias fasciatus TaxID=181472 RepID=A0A672HT39_SALFA
DAGNNSTIDTWFLSRDYCHLLAGDNHTERRGGHGDGSSCRTTPHVLLEGRSTGLSGVQRGRRTLWIFGADVGSLCGYLTERSGPRRSRRYQRYFRASLQ